MMGFGSGLCSEVWGPEAALPVSNGIMESLCRRTQRGFYEQPHFAEACRDINVSFTYQQHTLHNTITLVQLLSGVKGWEGKWSKCTSNPDVLLWEACSSLDSTEVHTDEQKVKRGTHGSNGPHIAFLQEQTMLVYTPMEGRAAGVNHGFDIQT